MAKAYTMDRVNMDKETGVEELRIIVNMMDREGELHAFTAEEIIKICRAVRASGWDVYPGEFSRNVLRFAARTGRLPKYVLTHLEKNG